MTDSIYSRYFLENAVKEISPQPGESMKAIVVNHESWPGVDDIKCNFAFIPVMKPGLMPDPPHTHDTDEFLYFLPGDAQNINDFQAEIEIALGEQWEKYVITKPTVLYIPRGLQHCPLYIKKVNKPFFFGHIMSSPKYEKTSNSDQT
ncbi:MAG: hypothetical protein JXA46_06505 [Dehalococcoidales bacterium]|nr:hypothetical protein [Dehalococcoidales bacterium]